MNAPERYAALRVLQHGISAAVDHAAQAVEQLRADTGAKSFETTYGAVSFTKRKPTIAINPRAFLDWCEEHAPDEIVTEKSVRSSYVKAIEAKLTIAGDQVVDADGVVVDWATVRPGTEYIGAKLNDDARSAIAEQVVSRIDELAAFPQLGAQPDRVVELAERWERTHPFDSDEDPS